jgi:hypothetical protein
MMEGEAVDVNGKADTSAPNECHRFRTVAFEIDGREYQAIEQNPEKPSCWAQLARKGHRVVQFKEAELNKSVAVAVDGKVKFYGAGRGSQRHDS